MSQILPPCCPRKQVGGLKYKLTAAEDTSAYGCLENCTYSREDETNGLNYCFREGDLQSNCTAGCGCGREKVLTRLNVSSADVTSNFAAYNKALKSMKDDSKITKIGFENIATYHGIPFRCNADQSNAGNENGCCIDHWNQASKGENFVTWHRLFTYNMEQSLIDHSPSDPLPMPYWDWTNPPNANVALPTLALQGEWTNGPKLDANWNPDGVTHRNFPTTHGISYTTDYYRQLVKTSFKQTNYVQFNQQIVWPHNMIHSLIGGDMGGSSFASYDPIFYLHHSYVDLQFAYFQALQSLRYRNITRNSFCKTAQGCNGRLQPFASKHVNPYCASQENSIGYQTLDYEGNFCYKYSNLLFDGLTPKEFIEREKEEMKKPSIFAGVPMKTTGNCSTVSFELTSPSTGSLATGALHYFGNGQDPSLERYTDYNLNLYDYTDILANSDSYSQDTTIKAKITNVDNEYTAYQPVVVYRPPGSNCHIYRMHVDDIQSYAPIMYGQPGAKLQFLDGNGERTKDPILEYYIGEGGYEGGYRVNTYEDQEIKYNEHKYQHYGSGTNFTYGYAPQYECDASGDPICNPDYYDDGAPAVTVIYWDTSSYEEYVTAYVGRHRQVIVLAWCHGQYANVNQVTKEDYDDCTNLDPHRARYGPASYSVDTCKPGTYYFASGVQGACQKGWKIKIEVQELGG